MTYLLDTDICIYILNERDDHLMERFRSVRPIDVAVSAVTLAELDYGAARSKRPEKNRERVRALLFPLTILAFDEAAAGVYGDLRAATTKKGRTVGAMDLLIAATAKAHGLTIVTNNVKEFRRFKGLKVENWAD